MDSDLPRKCLLRQTGLAAKNRDPQPELTKTFFHSSTWRRHRAQSSHIDTPSATQYTVSHGK